MVQTFRPRDVRLHSMFPSPIAGSFIIFRTVSLEKLGRFGHQRIVRIGIAEKRADGEKHLRDGQSRRPLGLQNVETYVAVRINVLKNQEEERGMRMCMCWGSTGVYSDTYRVIDTRSEAHSGRLKWIVSGKVDSKEKHTTRVGTIGWTADCCLLGW